MSSGIRIAQDDQPLTGDGPRTAYQRTLVKRRAGNPSRSSGIARIGGGKNTRCHRN